MAKNSEQPIKRASDFISADEQVTNITPTEDVEGIDLIVNSYEVKRGQFGDYYILDCVLPETGEQVFIRNGGQSLKTCLERVGAKRNLPIIVKFMRHNKQWVIS